MTTHITFYLDWEFTTSKSTSKLLNHTPYQEDYTYTHTASGTFFNSSKKSTNSKALVELNKNLFNFPFQTLYFLSSNQANMSLAEPYPVCQTSILESSDNVFETLYI